MEENLKLFIVLGTFAPICGAIAWNIISVFRGAREVVFGRRRFPPPEKMGVVIHLHPRKKET
jgi:hypothetical protein